MLSRCSECRDAGKIERSFKVAGWTADNSGWASTQKGDRAVSRELRTVLAKYQLDEVPGLFDRAHDYISEHY